MLTDQGQKAMRELKPDAKPGDRIDVPDCQLYVLVEDVTEHYAKITFGAKKDNVILSRQSLYVRPQDTLSITNSFTLSVNFT